MLEDATPAEPVAVPAAEPTAPAAAPAPAETPAAEPGSLDQSDSLASHEQALSERDATGRFTRGRHRARSQQAGPDDVGRIGELTRQLRTAERERDALKTPASPAAPAAAAPAPAPVPRAAAPPPPRVATPPPVVDDPEPRVEDEKFADYSDWIKAHNRWSAREELRERDKVTTQRETAQQTDTERRRIAESFSEKITAAKTRYPDFQQVALDAPSAIPPGSIIDAWIFEHKSGADVLYHLQKSPTELQQILALPLLDQVEHLTLLGQRLASSPPRAAAVSTGAAPTVPVVPAPRPPTPVRTGPMRTGSELPGDDASLRDHEHAFEYKGRRR